MSLLIDFAFYHSSIHTTCFYDNQNKTLPIGQDLSTKILVDTQKLELKLPLLTNFNIIKFENEKDDFSEIKIKKVKVLEYDLEEEVT